MKYFSVEVEDHINHNIVVVGHMLTLAEARRLQKEIEFFNACYVYVREHNFWNKKGKLL